MRQIGGDLLFVHHPPGNDAILSAVVLDVTGHGIRAALTVNRLLGELERLFAESPDARPEEILRGLNRYVALTLSRHTIFATAFVARVDAASGELRWASGGHPTAFVRRAANGQVLQPLESTAALLGVIAADEYDVVGYTTTLSDGDVLIAYTDGVCEACDLAGTQLGTNGTHRLIVQACARQPDPAQWPCAILRGVLGYRGTPVEDDTLIVAISLDSTSPMPRPERELGAHSFAPTGPNLKRDVDKTS
jgi:sigma-B regulation protein RsbU (phosphoserine phosphatase)